VTEAAEGESLLRERARDLWRPLILANDDYFHDKLSGLEVQPNNNDEGSARDRLFGMAEGATADDSGKAKRTITMVGAGILVNLVFEQWARFFLFLKSHPLGFCLCSVS
jgi:hypothetical protein